MKSSEQKVLELLNSIQPLSYDFRQKNCPLIKDRKMTGEIFGP